MKELKKEIKNNIENNNIEKVAELLLKANEKSDDVKNIFKFDKIFPDPLSPQESLDYYIMLLGALRKIEDKLDKDNFKKLINYFFTGATLSYKNMNINNYLSNIKYFNYNTVEQLQILSIFIEDQIRLAYEKSLDNIQNKEFFCPQNFVNKPIDFIESIVEISDIIYRYIFYKSNSIDGNFSMDLNPYEIDSFNELIFAANYRSLISNIWNHVKYNDWEYKFKDGTYYYGVSKLDSFIRNEAAIMRYRAYINELRNVFLLNPEYRENLKLYKKRTSEIDVNVDEVIWNDFPSNEEVKKLFSLNNVFEIATFEFFERIYKENIKNIYLGPSNKKVSGKNLLDTKKVIYILSEIYQNNSWEKLNNEKINYSSLVPIIKKEDLLDIIINVTELSKQECINSLNLLTFNTDNEKLDMW